MPDKTYDVIIIGGGLAGLCCALHLADHARILLIEKQQYPHHKVCGEYVSNEVLPYLKSLGIDPMAAGAKVISKFEISTKKGAIITSKLPLGGFGISRFTLDQMLFEAARDRVDFCFGTVTSISHKDGKTNVTTQNKQSFTANMAVGAFGKRSNLDMALHRKFTKQKSSWLAVKAHYDYDFPKDTVSLHNFEGGYCGLSQIETGSVNACYLTSYASFQRFGNIDEFQKNVLSKNKHLKHFFNQAVPRFEKPLTISQISFDQKRSVENHVFMLGDSAGLIHPLCGNGMAMAIHSAKLFSEGYVAFISGSIKSQKDLEHWYEQTWNDTFSKRLKTGRTIQKLLLNPTLTHVGLGVAKLFPSLIPKIIKQTHGAPIL